MQARTLGRNTAGNSNAIIELLVVFCLLCRLGSCRVHGSLYSAVDLFAGCNEDFFVSREQLVHYLSMLAGVHVGGEGFGSHVVVKLELGRVFVEFLDYIVDHPVAAFSQSFVD